uniref:PE301R n=1 Tax=African swine fever virus TaxID=10497 RepID=A0A6G7KUF3_ASF
MSADIRRGPGRPPKKRVVPNFVRKGILEKPVRPQSRLEFSYVIPLLFTNLFIYFTNLTSTNILVRCTPTEITFFSRVQSQASFVIATIDGKNVYHYYASVVFWLRINTELVAKMFISIVRSFLQITIVHRYVKPATLFFIFTDFVIDKECTYHITVSEPELDMDLIAMEKSISAERLKNYPLRWEFTSKQLKKTFTDLSNYTELVSIAKLGGDTPLHLYFQKFISISYHEMYISSNKINLSSTIPMSQVFQIYVTIAHIKSLASAMVTDKIRILCEENGNLFFQSEMDALMLYTITLYNMLLVR